MFAVISIPRLEQMLDQGQDLVMIDLRSPEEYGAGHLAGAVNIPEEELCRDRLMPYAGRLLVFYCTHGGKSMRAARDWGKRGFHAASLGSGIQYYRGKYGPMSQNPH